MKLMIRILIAIGLCFYVVSMFLPTIDSLPFGTTHVVGYRAFLIGLIFLFLGFMPGAATSIMSGLITRLDFLYTGALAISNFLFIYFLITRFIRKKTVSLHFIGVLFVFVCLAFFHQFISQYGVRGAGYHLWCFSYLIIAVGALLDYFEIRLSTT